MGRFSRYLNTVLNGAFIILTAGIVLLGVLSLFGGPTLRYAPYIAGLGCLYYLGMAAVTFLGDGRRRGLKGVLLLLPALFCAVMTYVAYRCLT